MNERIDKPAAERRRHYSTQLFDANYVDANYWMPIIQGGVGLVAGAGGVHER